MKYLIREVFWEYDDSEYNENGYLGFGGAYKSRKEAEDAKVRLERAAYRSFLSELLHLEWPKRSYEKERVYRFFVERLGADRELLVKEPYDLPDEDDLPFQLTAKDLDELREIIGADFVRIVEASDFNGLAYRARANPILELETDSDNEPSDPAAEFFTDWGTAIVSFYKNRLFSWDRTTLSLLGSIEQLARTPNILANLVASSPGLSFSDDMLVLSDKMSDAHLISVNALLVEPPVIVDEIPYDQLPGIKKFDPTFVAPNRKVRRKDG